MITCVVNWLFWQVSNLKFKLKISYEDITLFIYLKPYISYLFIWTFFFVNICLILKLSCIKYICGSSKGEGKLYVNHLFVKLLVLEKHSNRLVTCLIIFFVDKTTLILVKIIKSSKDHCSITWFNLVYFKCLKLNLV